MLITLVSCSSNPDMPMPAADHAAHAATPTPANATPGEVAPWTADADTIHVNNRLCAVSHSPLASDKLGAFEALENFTRAFDI